MRTPLKLLVGLGIPYGTVVGLLPWVASVDHPVLGVPFVYAWRACRKLPELRFR